MTSFNFAMIGISVCIVLVFNQANATGKASDDWPKTKCTYCKDSMDYMYRFHSNEDNLDFKTFSYLYEDEIIKDHLSGHQSIDSINRNKNKKIADDNKNIEKAKVKDNNEGASSSYANVRNPCGCCSDELQHCCADYLIEVCLASTKDIIMLGCLEFMKCLCNCPS